MRIFAQSFDTELYTIQRIHSFLFFKDGVTRDTSQNLLFDFFFPLYLTVSMSSIILEKKYHQAAVDNCNVKRRKEG